MILMMGMVMLTVNDALAQSTAKKMPLKKAIKANSSMKSLKKMVTTEKASDAKKESKKVRLDANPLSIKMPKSKTFSAVSLKKEAKEGRRIASPVYHKPRVLNSHSKKVSK